MLTIGCVPLYISWDLCTATILTRCGIRRSRPPTQQNSLNTPSILVQPIPRIWALMLNWLVVNTYTIHGNLLLLHHKAMTHNVVHLTDFTLPQFSAVCVLSAIDIKNMIEGVGVCSFEKQPDRYWLCNTMVLMVTFYTVIHHYTFDY